MSAIDKLVSALTPPATDEQRTEARARAREIATPGDWLSQILDHHERIEEAFAAVKSAGDAASRRAALKRLGVWLNGHSMAEEATVYPALAQADHKMHANTAYTEQVAAKMQLGALERMDPMSQDFEDKLGHLEGAVQTHVYQEESSWFLEMKREAPDADQEWVTRRYAEEFGRYMSGGEAAPAGERASALERPTLEPRSFGDQPNL